ncbi:MAG: alpha-2-macroglobulin [Spirochaetales bacterium]|nr:alpha-2-macroglobulin [Spirochaetales bacterium]
MSKRGVNLFVRAAAAVVFMAAGLVSCSHEGLPGPDPKVVAAFTGGIVPRGEALKVVFTGSYDTSAAIPARAFQLKPYAKGSLAWENEWTLVFTPEAPLEPERRYTATVDPSLLSAAGSAAGSGFSFEFTTLPPPLEIRFDPLKIDGRGEVLVSGTAAVEKGLELSRLAKVLRSDELGEPRWSREEEASGVFRFAFAPFSRGKSPREVAVRWDGGPLGAKEKGSEVFRIPEGNAFEVLSIRQPEKNIFEITFSSPLGANQDLRGFVSLSGDTNIRYSVEGNVARIFGSDDVPPGAVLAIQDLADAEGKKLVHPVQYAASANWDLPALRFAGSGVILPSSQGSAMVIETLNISGLIVEAFQIYGDNMVQFLQVNGLAGERELSRVGEPAWTQALDFPWSGSDKNRWVRRGLDLSELSRKYPGSMFRLRVSFRKRHVHYEAPGAGSGFSGLEFPGDAFSPIESGESGAYEEESSGWDYFQNQKWNDDWYRHRKNPDHPAFYLNYHDHNITVGRNVLVSDLALMAKKTASEEYLIVASDLRTAAPASGVELQFLSFPGRVLETARTGADGMAFLKPREKPAFIFAKSGAGRAFIRLNDGLALSSSHFDVSGVKSVDGIKGTIYGERGVWRPGDAIYLTFLMWDTKGTLPENHPVGFELEDPRGRVVENKTFTEGTDGFYAISTSTRADAPTGDWTARVRVGGSLFSKNLKIETIMPNRLKIDLSAAGKTYLDASPVDMTLESAWLHGAPAPNLKADVSVVFVDRDTDFPGFADYTFRDPSRSVSQERIILFEGDLDGGSKANFPVRLNAGNAVPGKLSARFLTRVFETSGVFSSEQVSMDFSPYGRYVGIKLPRGDAARDMLLTDTLHTADIVVLDAEGKPVKDGVELECAVYKLNWRWWWEKGKDEAAEFASSMSRTPVMRGSVTTSGGRASWQFQVKYPDWGRYLIMARDRRGGHAAAKIAYIDWPGWAGRSREGGQGSSAMLNLTTDKASYAPGENITVSFPSNTAAAALIVVEKGGEIISRQWIGCAETTTEYTFRAGADMTPNVYVHVTLLQQHLQTANDLPIRLYGIIPVIIDDSATRLTPQITAPASWQPSSKASFTVREAQGKPMTYTAVVVDEGLLGLTRYSMPNPRGAFYRKEASFMKYWDVYSEVIGAYSGKLETLLAIGGGDDEMDTTAKQTQRFKPVVFSFGPCRLGAGETRTETFDMPQYVGAVRVMVVAGSPPAAKTAGPRPGRAYGAAEQSVQVKSDLMVLGAIPRVLSPDDEAAIPVTIFAYAEGKRSVRVGMKVEGNASLVSSASADVAFDKSGEKTAGFRVKAGSPGKVKFTITASSPGLKDAVHTTELDIRSTALPVSKALTQLLSENGKWEGLVELPGVPGTNTAALELSRMPPLGLEKRLTWLMQYPHGCVEQTTSAVFPQLHLDKALALRPDELALIRMNIAEGIERLAGFQNYTGGFSYWPGAADVSVWGTNYAGHFLVAAKGAGYAVPDTLLKNWTDYQKKQAAAWAGSSYAELLDQAYRLYTLALAGQADIGSMNRLRERGDNPPAVLWRLAAAYWYAGQRDAARSMVKDAALGGPDYRELSGTFGSSFRDRAMMLEALALMGDDGRARDLLESVAERLSSEDWLSTQETAYALIAVLPFMQSSADNAPITVDYTVDGKTETLIFGTPMAKVPLNVSGTQAKLTLQNRSGAFTYARVYAAGLPAEGSEPALSNGLSLRVRYRNADTGMEENPSRLSMGQDVIIDVEVRNTYGSEVKEIALVHALPASFEIINTRTGEDPASSVSSVYKYQDIRDDRIMSYFDLSGGQSKTFSFRVNKTYSGSFFQPAIHAYAMYNETIRALIPGQR